MPLPFFVWDTCLCTTISLVEYHVEVAEGGSVDYEHLYSPKAEVNTISLDK